MNTHPIKEKEKPASPALPDQEGQKSALPSPPRPRPPGRTSMIVFSLLIVMILALTLGGILFAQLATRPNPTPGPTPAATSSPGVTSPSPTAGMDVTPTPQPGVIQGPQSCSGNTQQPAYWEAILGIAPGQTSVERVSCANVQGNRSLQALVLVRHHDASATADLYVFDNITATHPTRLFSLGGLMRGDAAFSFYNTVMTAQIDPQSAVNLGKPGATQQVDLFREFAWDAGQHTLVQTAFPGLFPDLTRYQAERDQTSVSRGKDLWKNDARQVAEHLARQFLSWQRPLTTTLISGGGSRDVAAVVRVTEAPMQGATSLGPTILVTLSRLEGAIHHLWVATGMEDGSLLTLTSIEPRSLVTSPVTFSGRGSAYEGVIGNAFVLDHLYQDIGHAQVTGSPGMGKALYTTRVLYQSSFHQGAQEGLAEVQQANAGISNKPASAILVKVLLDPEPGVTLGPLPCPAAVASPAHWDPIVSVPPTPVRTVSVSCGNLLGRSSLQAVVLGTLILGGGPVLRNVYVFDRITSAQPNLLFKVERLYKGDARISGYSTLLTAEVDPHSRINEGKGDSAMTPDLFREFQWAQGLETFAQTAFPGLYPDLTRYQAERDQTAVNQGADRWKNDALQSARNLTARFLKWPATAPASLLNGGGPQDIDATVQVRSPFPGGGTVTITFSRLEGDAHNIWMAIAVRASGPLSIALPHARDLVGNPVTINGTGAAFEGEIGTAFVLDHLYTEAGQGRVQAQSANGMGQSSYTLSLPYTVSYHGVQEGVIALYAYSMADSSVATAVLVKVLLKG